MIYLLIWSLIIAGITTSVWFAIVHKAPVIGYVLISGWSYVIWYDLYIILTCLN